MGITSRVLLIYHSTTNLEWSHDTATAFLVVLGQDESSNRARISDRWPDWKHCINISAMTLLFVQGQSPQISLCQILISQVLHKSTGGFHIEIRYGEAPTWPEKKVSQHLYGHRMSIFVPLSPPQPSPWSLKPQPIIWLYITSQIGLVKE